LTVTGSVDDHIRFRQRGAFLVIGEIGLPEFESGAPDDFRRMRGGLGTNSG